MKSSNIAASIDNEYRVKERIFRRKYCDYCKNRSGNLCEIGNTIDHQLRCIYYEKEDK